MAKNVIHYSQSDVVLMIAEKLDVPTASVTVKITNSYDSQRERESRPGSFRIEVEGKAPSLSRNVI